MTIPMQEPRRWLDPEAGGPRALRELLESAASDAPSAEQLGSLSARLGDLLAPVAAAGLAEAISPDPVTSAGGASAPVASAVAKGGASVLTKVLVAAGAVAVGGGGFQAGRVYEAKVERVTPVTIAAQPVPPPIAEPMPEPLPVPEQPAAPAPAIASPRPPPAKPVARPSPLPADEPGLLDSALRAMRGGEFTRALEITSEHRRRHPNGVLGQEREVIAIEALVRLGRTADARAAADRFRASFPTSGHLLRIDSLLRTAE